MLKFFWNTATVLSSSSGIHRFDDIYGGERGISLIFTDVLLQQTALPNNVVCSAVIETVELENYTKFLYYPRKFSDTIITY